MFPCGWQGPEYMRHLLLLLPGHYLNGILPHADHMAKISNSDVTKSWQGTTGTLILFLLQVVNSTTSNHFTISYKPKHKLS